MLDVHFVRDNLEAGALSCGYLAISRAYEALGQTAEAFEAYRLFHEVVARVQDDASTQFTRYMESTIELERSKAEAELRAREKRVEKLSIISRERKPGEDEKRL